MILLGSFCVSMSFSAEVLLYAKLTNFNMLSQCKFGFTESRGKPRSASEGRLQLDGCFLKNEAIHCYKHKSHCQIEPMKITLPSYCEPTQSRSRI